jgi:hypothetical protein
MAVSPVANGQNATAEQYNALVTYLQDTAAGHDHAGTTNKGKRVSHVNVTDGKISDLGASSHTHQVIDNHLDAAAGNATHNAHGLITGIYVAGAYGSQLVIFTGYFTGTDLNGTVYFSSNGLSPATCVFTAAPKVFVQIVGNTGDSLHTKDVVDISGVTTNLFEYHRAGGYGSYSGFYFMAIGVKSS